MFKTKVAKGYIVAIKDGSGATFGVPEINEVVAVEDNMVILKPYDEILTEATPISISPIFVTNIDNIEVEGRNKFDYWLDNRVRGCQCFGPCDCEVWVGHWRRNPSRLKRMTYHPVYTFLYFLCWLLHDHSVDSTVKIL